MSIHSYQLVLQEQGPAGLEYLNSRIPHRYTAVFQIQDGLMKNRFFCDKEGQIKPEFLEEVPLADSFCQIVIREGAFATENSALDQRLNGHKYQGVIGAYYGLPLIDNSGDLYGTICHFDVGTIPLADAEFTLLKQVSIILPRYILRNHNNS